MKSVITVVSLCLMWLLPTGSYAQRSPYTLTIFADGGSNASLASSHGSNFGHIFIELTNGDNHIYMGYYGAPEDPSKGQLRVDADLAQNGYWDVKKTYQITEKGYSDAHNMIDTWGTKKGSWKLWCNCSDFAEAVATVAGVELGHVPKELGLNTPRSWAQYLRDHGGTVNPSRAFDGQWRCAETNEHILISHSGNKYYTTFFNIHWALALSGQQLTASQGLTSAEIIALFDVPADIARQFVGAPAVLVLTISDANHIAYATAAPRKIRRNPQTGKLSLEPGAPIAGTLIRLH